MKHFRSQFLDTFFHPEMLQLFLKVSHLRSKKSKLWGFRFNHENKDKFREKNMSNKTLEKSNVSLLGAKNGVSSQPMDLSIRFQNVKDAIPPPKFNIAARP